MASSQNAVNGSVHTFGVRRQKEYPVLRGFGFDSMSVSCFEEFHRNPKDSRSAPGKTWKWLKLKEEDLAVESYREVIRKIKVKREGGRYFSRWGVSDLYDSPPLHSGLSPESEHEPRTRSRVPDKRCS